MSARPASHRWEVVGESSDPVPGDPEDVARLGRELRRTADAIEKQAGEIKALASVEAWKSKTAEEYRDQAKGASDKLRKAFRRYDEASRALGTTVDADVCSNQYASELARAQKMADKALSDAETADEDRRTAKSALAAQPDDTPKDDPATKRHEKAEENADSALKAAKDAVDAAKSIRDAAAKRAADAIHDVIEDDGLKDGWKDKFQNWVHENSGWLKEISKWAGRIALAAGVLALVVGWIPVIGQIAAAALNAVALLASVTALAVDLVLYLGGEGSLKAVLLDAVGVATFGLGRAAIMRRQGGRGGGESGGTHEPLPKRQGRRDEGEGRLEDRQPRRFSRWPPWSGARGRGEGRAVRQNADLGQHQGGLQPGGDGQGHLEGGDLPGPLSDSHGQTQVPRYP